MTPFEYLSLVVHPELANVRIRGLRFLSAVTEWVTDTVFANASDARWWITHDMTYAEMCHAVLLEDDQFQVEYERRARPLESEAL
jgi:hypothetical protein